MGARPVTQLRGPREKAPDTTAAGDRVVGGPARLGGGGGVPLNHSAESPNSPGSSRGVTSSSHPVSTRAARALPHPAPHRLPGRPATPATTATPCRQPPSATRRPGGRSMEHWRPDPGRGLCWPPNWCRNMQGMEFWDPRQPPATCQH